MPKDTFFKLSAEKQQRIVDAATEEFVYYKDNYEKASVKRIAKNAEIAIGSIYKYFENKNDLFNYILEFHRKMPDTDPHADTLYAFSKEEKTIAVKQTETSSVLGSIAVSNKDLFRYLIFDTISTSDYFKRIQEYLEKDHTRNLLKEDINMELVAYIYASIEYIIHNYCTSKGLDFHENFEKLFDQTARMLFFGIYHDGAEEQLEDLESK